MLKICECRSQRSCSRSRSSQQILHLIVCLFLPGLLVLQYDISCSPTVEVYINLMGCFTNGKANVSTAMHDVDLKTRGTRLRSISPFISHFTSSLRAAAPCQKPFFHVAAVIRQTSCSKMLINVTGSMLVLDAVI